MGKFSETCVALLVIGLATVTCYPSILPSPEAGTVEDVAIPKVLDDSIPNVVDSDGDAHPAIPTPAPEVTANDGCDCQDAEALYTKLVRTFINMKVVAGKEEFLKQIQMQKVCGSDGRMYRVGCDFECAKEKDSELRRAGRKAHCRKNNLPKNQQRHAANHADQPVAARLTLEPPFPFEEGTRKEHPKVCICGRNYYPVCASNGVTYGNKCAFNCAKQNLDKDLTIVTEGVKCNPEDDTVIKR